MRELVRSWKFLILQSRWTHPTPAQSDSANCANLLLWVARVYRNEKSLSLFRLFFLPRLHAELKFSLVGIILWVLHTPSFNLWEWRGNIIWRVIWRRSMNFIVQAIINSPTSRCRCRISFSQLLLCSRDFMLTTFGVTASSQQSHTLSARFYWLFLSADDIGVDCWVRSDFNWKIVECGKKHWIKYW